MKIPFLTFTWDRNQRRVVVGFGIYRVGVGVVLRSATWEALWDWWPWL